MICAMCRKKLQRWEYREDVRWKHDAEEYDNQESVCRGCATLYALKREKEEEKYAALIRARRHPLRKFYDWVVHG